MLSESRLTHIALPVSDMGATLAFYSRFTPLVTVQDRSDESGRTVWLGHHGQVENPFVVVLVCSTGAAPSNSKPTLAPLAHLGIEVAERAEVDRIAALGREAGCLAWEPTEWGPPVGYVCALTDPDGNMVEFSHAQGVYDAVQGMFGTSSGSLDQPT